MHRFFTGEQSVPEPITSTTSRGKSFMKTCTFPKDDNRTNISSTPTPHKSYSKVSDPPTTVQSRTSITRPKKQAREDGDIDPLRIDELICAKLSASKQDNAVASLQKDLQAVLWILKNSSSDNEKVRARVEARTYQDKLVDISQSFDLGYYKYRTADLLTEYRDLLQKARLKSFVGTAFIASEYIQNARRRSELILEYLSIAEKFIDLVELDIPGYIQPVCHVTCPQCNSSDLITENYATYTCKCGIQIEELDMSPIYADSERINTSAKYQYTCQQHFSDATNNYEGSEKLTLSSKRQDEIFAEMKYQGLSAKTITKDQLYVILTEKKMNDLYEHINLLYSRITGKPCPSIGKIRPLLSQLFRELESVYPDIKEEDRTNSMHVNFKLYKCLQFAGHKCHKDDFYMLRTAGKLEDHEEKWREWVEVLKVRYPRTGWKYIPTR